MIHCMSCGKEMEPPFPGVLHAKCSDCRQADAETASSTGVAAAAAPPVAQVIVAGPAFRPIVTYALIGLNVLVFVAMVVTGVSFISPAAPSMVSWGANFGPETLSGQWWRLLSAIFLHFGIIHLALNMWCLFSLGTLCEAMMGRATLVTLYLITGIGGGLVSLAWHPMVVSAGASGAVFGIAGALVSLFYLGNIRAPSEMMRKSLGSVGTFIVYNFVYGAMQPQIDNSAHLGGLVTGVIAGALLRQSKQNPAQRSLGIPVGAAFAAVLALGAFQVRRMQLPVTQLGLAEQLLETGQTDRAIALLREVVQQQPNLAAAHYMLGNAYMQANQNDAAVKELLKAVGTDGDNPNFKLNLGVAYLRNGDPLPAIHQFQEILTKNIKNQKAQIDLGIAYYTAKQYDSALVAFSASLVLKPNDPVAYAFMGDSYLAKGDSGKAILQYQKALAVAPNNTQAGEGLCTAAVQRRDLAQATSCFEKFVALHPKEQTARAKLAALYRAAGRNQDAQTTLAGPSTTPQKP